MRTRPAFTLPEVLIVITVVSVLIALTIPQLSQFRDRAMDARQLSSLRQHASIIAMYQSDFKGAFPFLTDPRNETTTLRCERFDFQVDIRLFDVWRWWHVGLADRYYDGQMFSTMFTSRDAPGGTPFTSFMLYPFVFSARPEYWNYNTRTSLDAQLGATFDSDVRHPSKKILLGEWAAENDRRFNGHDALPAAFVDGSASVFSLVDLRPVSPPEPTMTRHRTGIDTFDRFLPWFYTLDGVRGRDIP